MTDLSDDDYSAREWLEGMEAGVKRLLECGSNRWSTKGRRVKKRRPDPPAHPGADYENDQWEDVFHIFHE